MDLEDTKKMDAKSSPKKADESSEPRKSTDDKSSS